MVTDIQKKNIIETIVRGVLKVFDSDLFRDSITRYVTKKYDDGLLKSEEIFKLNFIRDPENVFFLNDYVTGELGYGIDEIGKKLRSELQRAKFADKSVDEIKKIVKDFFKKKNQDKYMNRLKMIIRTEGNRAENAGLLDGAKQSRLNWKKYLKVQLSKYPDGRWRTSPICREMHKKYGSPEKAIDLDKDFKAKGKGYNISLDQPPFHVHCRTTLFFTEVEEET